MRRSYIPSEATFSRACKEFAELGLGEKVHPALVTQWVTPELVGHINWDATAIQGREKPTAKPKLPKPAPRKKLPPWGGAKTQTGDAFGAPRPAIRSCRR